ncbi:MAG: hypothetical protein FJ206_02585 [Gemmatimonadetes bacterium]|nr:hypothetical protein [Gemmatimonadota bacterium]
MRRIGVLVDREAVATPEVLAAARRFGKALGEHRALAVVLGPLIGATRTLVQASTGVGGRGLVLTPEPTEELDQVEIRVVADRPAACREMVDRVEAFVVIPGAVASLDDAFEPWDWAGGTALQPLALWDVDDAFSKLLRHASDAAVDRFARESQRGQLIMSRDPDDILRRLADYRPPETRRGTAFSDD